MKDVTVFLPVGGKAKRALEVTGDVIPKHLITLGNGRTVLETMLRELQRVGFRRFVFCIGHHHEHISHFVQAEGWIVDERVHYDLVYESTPLGPEGAILAAIEQLRTTGQAMFVAGDMIIPWNGLCSMNRIHAERNATATMGLTSYVTERTTDVNKIIVDERDRIVRCFGRQEMSSHGEGERALTSAALTVVSVQPYLELGCDYRATQTHVRTASWRDNILPWALRSGGYSIYGHDLKGEVLDLGTPDNIRYGQERWGDYVDG